MRCCRSVSGADEFINTKMKENNSEAPKHFSFNEPMFLLTAAQVNR